MSLLNHNRRTRPRLQKKEMGTSLRLPPEVASEAAVCEPWVRFEVEVWRCDPFRFVDGRYPANSPVEGKVVYPIIYSLF